MTGFRLRYLGPLLLIALCFVTLCAITAVSLFRQQATVTQVLRESVTGRQAAADLRGCLNVLVELEHRHVESVADLHEQARGLLRNLRRYARTPTELDLADRMDAGFAEYLDRWRRLPPAADPTHDRAVTEATRLLETDVLVPCREFEGQNDRRIEAATSGLERVLGQLAWGLAGIGLLGGVSGVVLGFGVAKWVARSIRRLRVQIRDAAGMIGPEPGEIVVTGEGEFHGLHDELDELTGRIELLVRTLQQREIEVLRAEQLAAVGQLAAGVGHEIRNPLTSIKMLVQAGLEGDGLTADDLRVIEGEIRRMEATLNTFLNFSRPPTSDRNPTDLGELIRGVADLIRGRADQQGVEVGLTLPADGVVVPADGEQLRQVLVNLCLNALDAMPTGGRLDVTVKPKTPGRVGVTIADTGPGIPRAIMARLFQPFVSSKETGLGLGLVISRRIVEDHGGTIAAANRPEGGASFFLTLPVPEPTSQRTSDAESVSH